jgi:hypothetical protein
MDALVVKFGANTYRLFGSAEELMEVIALLESSSFRLECGFEAGLIILAKNTRKYEFDFSEVKNILFTEIINIQKMDVTTQAFLEWSRKGFDDIDFSQEIETWAERLPK